MKVGSPYETEIRRANMVTSDRTRQPQHDNFYHLVHVPLLKRVLIRDAANSRDQAGAGNKRVWFEGAAEGHVTDRIGSGHRYAK